MGVPLDKVDVAAPCPARWEDMKGGERVRFCEQCRLNVYNLSSMERAEAERLVNETEGRLCVRFFRRADGTMLTDDCPVGLVARARKELGRAVALIAGILGVGACGGGIERSLNEPQQKSARPTVPSGTATLGSFCYTTASAPASAGPDPTAPK